MIYMYDMTPISAMIDTYHFASTHDCCQPLYIIVASLRTSSTIETRCRVP